ncbi:3-hydroxyacyl-CoA dehydrogenase NAD-binding domain-containing protein [Variovorax saccharolyticus]|uniref:3-hydroxyacyl-CoA dehydrogenase NAD-binding domain-containing protein n=1 Tax=Variovorax saccharolyticus TaxID=3053516 RepID=UPI00257650CC|nr:3-hydroxyacyl-CoA dehydrogenase NAD-binding domain-containing protein [Variovorax sp. J22R187]MDM0021906.1 3-hydroxyacyl-CoA dehydrogenase NAD-binding domain-containing protein [Variovorax sp. J22R187]
MSTINASVALTRHDSIAVITIDSPPVNALSHGVREGLVQAVAQAGQDSTVRAILIACAGTTFIAGADITEFGKPPKDPRISAVIAAIEDCPKPIIAAMHGTVLGGGLELALGCHYRVAAPATRLGLPEVNLGIIPGAGGTQRLPRVVGVERAIELITTASQLSAKQALEAGLVDALIDGDLVQGALQFARRVVDENKALLRVRDRDEHLVTARGNPALFEKARAAVARKSRGLTAPLAAIDAIEAAVNLPFEQGLQRERELVTAQVSSDQSKALRYFFFAERESAKIPGIQTGDVAKVQQAAVIGAGTMGGGIAMSLANAGVAVTLIDLNPEALERGLGIIRKNYENTARRGGMTESDVSARMALIRPSTKLADVSSAEVIVEAVFENTELKKSVFTEIDRHARADAILGTNTSTLDIDEIASATARPESVIGLHFFSPANVMKLLEVVRTGRTSESVVARAMALGRQMRKVPVLVGTCDGFVGNRILRARSKQAEQIIMQGGFPEQVDRVLQDFGFPMGVFAMGDMAGLDIGWRIRKERGLKSIVADKLCEMGRLGQKAGAGYFRYDPANPEGARAPIVDPIVNELILQASRDQNIERRDMDDVLIRERLLYPMINEAAKILEEGVALRAGDIDVIWIYGYGWPRHRGGPMHYADSIGLAKIRDRLREFERDHGDAFKPAALLERLADEGGTFAGHRTGALQATAAATAVAA